MIVKLIKTKGLKPEKQYSCT